uniref:Ribosomal protein L5 n=1 Tax=Isoetes engelmannii TaxID=37427 RepID=C6FGQ3_ISOEN|nr:ribosomal protein L5 [Isoetes engelmannii]ACI95894.1 ribosomal protein L5 [Isoetes engelmannii]ACK38303.1 ribosomal protein L5 [Isoetes engelmannii]
MFTPFTPRFCSHYKNVPRQDLLLKAHYAIMEVPSLREVVVVLKAPSNLIKKVELAMEIICGQKPIRAEIESTATAKSSLRLNRSKKCSRYAGYVISHAMQNTLRGHSMYLFLEKLLTAYGYLVERKKNFAELLLSKESFRSLPEIHPFEFFEHKHIGGFDVTIVTSANTVGETFILLSSFSL